MYMRQSRPCSLVRTQSIHLHDVFHASIDEHSLPASLVQGRCDSSDCSFLLLHQRIHHLLFQRHPLRGPQPGQQVLILGHQSPIHHALPLPVARHAVLIKDPFSASADLRYTLHGFEGGGDEVAVVADGNVASGGEGEGAVDKHFFTGGFAERFGPLELSGGKGVSRRKGEERGGGREADFAGVAFHFELGVKKLVCGLGSGEIRRRLTFLWHLLLQKLKTRASLRTKVIPAGGYLNSSMNEACGAPLEG